MKRFTLTILILSITTICFGQTKEIKYLNNEWLQREVSAEKGKFSQTIIQNADGSLTTEIKNIKKDKLIKTYYESNHSELGTLRHLIFDFTNTSN